MTVHHSILDASVTVTWYNWTMKFHLSLSYLMTLSHGEKKTSFYMKCLCLFSNQFLLLRMWYFIESIQCYLAWYGTYMPSGLAYTCEVFFFRTDKKEISTSSYSLSNLIFSAFGNSGRLVNFLKTWLRFFFGNSGVLMNIK